MSKKGRN